MPDCLRIRRRVESRFHPALVGNTLDIGDYRFEFGPSTELRPCRRMFQEAMDVVVVASNLSALVPSIIRRLTMPCTAKSSPPVFAWRQALES